MVKANAAGTSLKGGGLLGEGKFHCVCESADVEVSEKFGNQQVKMKAVAYAPEEVKGRTLVDFLDVDGEYAGRLWAFAIALGLKSEADYEKAKADGSGEINEADFQGMQFFVEREMYVKKKDGKENERWSNRYYALNDPAAKDFPRSQELLELLDPALAGAAASSAPSAGSGNGSSNGGGSKSPTTTAQSTGGFDDPDM